MAIEIKNEHLPAQVDPMDTFEILDTYAGGVTDEAPSQAYIATISAGYKGRSKDGKPIPVRSRDGEIYISGQAPGLEAALQKTGRKKLTIAMSSNNPQEFLQQRFTQYSASMLKVWGDQKQITVVDENGNRKVFEAGSPGYQAALEDPLTKVSTSLYFVLADWTPQGFAVTFPDGLGVYRLRTTSRHSLRSIAASLRAISKITGGRFAGVPLDLWLEYREVTDRKAHKQNIPVWILRLQPPKALELTSKSLPNVLMEAIAEGERLALPSVLPESIEVAEADATEWVDEEALGEAVDGGLCDQEYWTKRWHAEAAGTEFEQTDARHAFIKTFTDGAHESLSAYLGTATEAQANALIVDLVSAKTPPEEDTEPPASRPLPPASLLDPSIDPWEDDGFQLQPPPTPEPEPEPFDRKVVTRTIHGLAAKLGWQSKELQSFLSDQYGAQNLVRVPDDILQDIRDRLEGYLTEGEAGGEG